MQQLYPFHFKQSPVTLTGVMVPFKFARIIRVGFHPLTLCKCSRNDYIINEAQVTLIHHGRSFVSDLLNVGSLRRIEGQ